MCVSTLRLLYNVSDAPTKEVVKEYFRLVGCLFCDEPICSVQEAENALRKNDSATIDIVLNLDVFNWEDYFLPEEPSDIHVAQVLLKDRKRPTLMVKCSPPKEGNLIEGEQGEANSKEKFYRNLIQQIIRKIWNDEPPNQKKQLLMVKDLYFDGNLFGFLQCKRALYVVNMGEALEILLRPRKISPDEYIGNMLLAFNKFYCALDDGKIKTVPDEPVSVYVRYARVNVARKIREIFSMLEEVPVLSGGKNIGFPSVDDYHVEFLLDELGKLYQQDPKYPGTLFLAAHVCQSEPAHKMDAAFYYQQLFEQIAEKAEKSYSFLYYEYGRYVERVIKDWELAVLYYTKAKKLDPLNYRALFKLACHEAKNKDFAAAKNSFKKVIRIIGETYSGASEPEKIIWEYLSLRNIQYLFKAYVWLRKISLNSNDYSQAEIYLHQAETIVSKFEENACLKAAYDIGSSAWKALEAYHKNSEPVLLLKEICKHDFRTGKDGGAEEI